MVFSKLNNKNKAYFTIFLFGIIALAFWYFADNFNTFISTSNPWLVMVVSIVLNPAYAVLIYYLWKEYDLRGIAAGIIISVAIDIMSLAHSINKLGVLPTGTTPLYGYSDTLFYKIIYPYIHGPTGVFVLYVVIPVGLIYLALRIIRRSASFNKIVKESI